MQAKPFWQELAKTIVEDLSPIKVSKIRFVNKPYLDTTRNNRVGNLVVPEGKVVIGAYNSRSEYIVCCIHGTDQATFDTLLHELAHASVSLWLRPFVEEHGKVWRHHYDKLKKKYQTINDLLGCSSMVEQAAVNGKVGGSSPPAPATLQI